MRDLLDCLWYDDPQQPEPVSTKKRQRRTNTVVFSPHELACAVAKHIPTFGEKGVQQDAQEFLLCTLGQLQEELRQEPPPAEHDSALPETIVSSVFGGRSMQKVYKP